MIWSFPVRTQQYGHVYLVEPGHGPEVFPVSLGGLAAWLELQATHLQPTVVLDGMQGAV